MSNDHKLVQYAASLTNKGKRPYQRPREQKVPDYILARSDSQAEAPADRQQPQR